MRANEFLVEAFDAPYKLKWEKSHYGDIDAYVKLDDGTYLSLMFNKGFDSATKQEAWSVEFHRNNSQEVTGEGDAQRVFATVLAAINQFVKKYKPKNIMFSASKEEYDDDTGEMTPSLESRSSLYTKLVQRYAAKMGYQPIVQDGGNQVLYKLTKLETT